MRRAQLWRVAWVAVAEVCTHRGKDYRGWRVDLFSGGQAWYEQKLSPDSQTTQHQHKFGPLNCQTRSQVVNVLTRVSSSPLGHCKTETTRAFQSSAQTTDYWSDKAGLLYWWEAFLSQSSSEQSEWSRLGERKEEERQHEPSVNWTCKVCPTYDGVCRSLLWRQGSTSLCRRKGQSERQLLRHQALAKSQVAQ